MKEPVKPLPAGEPCEYEKIKDINIRERQEEMKACGFFEDWKLIRGRLYWRKSKPTWVGTEDVCVKQMVYCKINK